jgi:hypothetical protein
VTIEAINERRIDSVPRVHASREAAPGPRFVGFRPIRFVGVEARRAARATAVQAAHPPPCHRRSTMRRRVCV